MAGIISMLPWGSKLDPLDHTVCLPPKNFPKPFYRPPLPTPDELAMDSAAKGDKASAASNYPLAIEHYTNALTEMPRAPGYYISRSTAYSRLKPEDGGPNFEAAFNDAEVALRLAFDRGNRELLLSAQMRRAVSLYQLERFGDASYLFELLSEKINVNKPEKNPGEDVKVAMERAESGMKSNYSTQLPIWLVKIRRQMDEKIEGDDKWAMTIKEIPDDVEIPTVAELKTQLAAVKAGNMEALARSKAASGPAKQLSAMEIVESTPAPYVAPSNYRHEWYQSNDAVFVTLYVKGLTHHVFTVQFTERSVITLFEFFWVQS